MRGSAKGGCLLAAETGLCLHRAVVRSMAAAAGGQGCALVVANRKGYGTQSEGKGQQDGENAPHLKESYLSYLFDAIQGRIADSGIIDTFRFPES